jgi:hypothetical protein
MDLVFATQAKGPETGTKLQSELLVLLVGHVGVSRELKELPLLFNLLDLAIDVLLDLLELLVHLDELAAADGMVVGKSAIAGNLFVAGGLDREGWFVNHAQGHDASLVSHYE